MAHPNTKQRYFLPDMTRMNSMGRIIASIVHIEYNLMKNICVIHKYLALPEIWNVDVMKESYRRIAVPNCF